MATARRRHRSSTFGAAHRAAGLVDAGDCEHQADDLRARKHERDGSPLGRQERPHNRYEHDLVFVAQPGVAGLAVRLVDRIDRGVRDRSDQVAAREHEHATDQEASVTGPFLLLLFVCGCAFDILRLRSCRSWLRIQRRKAFGMPDFSGCRLARVGRCWLLSASRHHGHVNQPQRDEGHKECRSQHLAC